MSTGNYVLNVHSSLTCGEMAIIDIGVGARWESFLVGEPVDELSVTIDQADTGRMAMTEKCHDYILANEAAAQQGGQLSSDSSLSPSAATAPDRLACGWASRPRLTTLPRAPLLLARARCNHRTRVGFGTRAHQ